ncbi:MAG: metallopeptidase family protein [Rhodothalassiaceae bacterium]
MQAPPSAWHGRRAPSADEIAALAAAAVATIPDPLRSHLAGVVFRVVEFPDAETLRDLGMEDDPFGLLGLYQGVSLAEKSSLDVPTAPDMIFLYRRPILDYWADSDETLDHLVRHVLIHEVGHHFGLSDEDMERIEAAADMGTSDPQS